MSRSVEPQGPFRRLWGAVLSSLPALSALAFLVVAARVSRPARVESPATVDRASSDESQSFFNTLRGAVLSSLPALSVLVFFVVAVKVFRAANMETATTVAVASSADTVALLKGVILTLLPGFLAGVVAVAVWWWADSVAIGASELGQARINASQRALLNPRFVLVWALVVMAFFTISWPVFLAFFLPITVSTFLLVRRSLGKGSDTASARRLPLSLRVAGLSAAVVSIAWLALSPTVWLPVRLVQLAPGYLADVNGQPLPDKFAAYVLSNTSDGTSLLLDSPRAVIDLPASAVAPNPPLCIFEPSPHRWLFLRASQVLRLDKDYGSPYVHCPSR